MPPAHDPRLRFRRSLWATIAFLVGFGLLITIVARYFLVPGMEAARDASAPEKRQLSAAAMLLLAVVMVIVVVGILVAFRVRRFFLPRGAPTPTKYVDAWAESARRLEVEPEQQDPREA